MTGESGADGEHGDKGDDGADKLPVDTEPKEAVEVDNGPGLRRDEDCKERCPKVRSGAGVTEAAANDDEASKALVDERKVLNAAKDGEAPSAADVAPTTLPATRERVPKPLELAVEPFGIPLL